MNIMCSTHFMISWLLLINFFLSTYSTSTLNTSHIFTDNGDTVISPKGTFELGFFNPDGSTNRYLGIWYKKITPRTVVWIANTNIPLANRSGMVRVIEPGIVVLLNATNSSIIWSTNTSRIVQSPVAELLDSGNLVVRDANDENKDNFLWQSFDFPTDTLLAGMKLGKNFLTGFEVYTTSKKSDVDPSPAEYTYHLDPTGYPQLEIKKGDVVTYRTGPWNGKGFSGNPNLQKNPIFTYEVVLNEKEAYYRFALLNDSLITMATMSATGVGQRWVWIERTQEWNSYLTIPVDNCDVYNGCGPYGSCNIKNSPSCGCLDRFEARDPKGQERGDWSSGCIRSTPLDCRKDGFLKYSGVKLPDTRNSTYNTSMSLEECKDECLKNCSCTAYTTLDIVTGDGCILWFNDLIDMREISPGQDIYIRVASSELGSRGKKKKILIITLSVVAGVLLICVVLYCRKRKKLDHELQEIALVAERSRHNYVDNHHDESGQSKEFELPLFDLATLMRATDSFSLRNKLGEGGFGPVYKARHEGQEIAVKRLSRTSLQGVDEFKNEVICIAKLQHRNLVKLLGCCIQGEEKILVYEYMTNRSLDLILFDPMKSVLLDWSMRFNIINGIARGLLYLHQDSRLRVIHRDLKASNILLDSNMNPKISDFGLARTFGGDETGANTSRVVGTYGYMSPEYAGEGLFSVKSDIFSYGVLVLEIVSGKRNRGFHHSDHHLNLLGHAWMLYREGRSLELIDPVLRNSCDLLEVQRSIHIGLLCVQELPQDRPSMSVVVLMLSNGGDLPEAKQPGFFTGREIQRNETSSSSNTSASANFMSITVPEGR